MRRLLAVLTLYALAACGSRSSGDSPSLPAAPDFSTELARVEALLPTCAGGPSKPGGNTLTGQTDCDNGDMLGAVGMLSLGGDARWDQFILGSQGPDGRLYRSPVHREWCLANGDAGDACSFSRDHVISVLFWTVGAYSRGVPEAGVTIRNNYDFAERGGYRICPDKWGRSQCGLTPGILDLMGDVLQHIGINRPLATMQSDTVNQIGSLASILSNEPSYHWTLVADQVYLKALTGQLTQGWRDLANDLVQHWPENLYFQYVYNYAHGGNQAKYLEIRNLLQIELTKFSSPGTCNLWSHGREPWCQSMGWDILWLGKLLL